MIERGSEWSYRPHLDGLRAVAVYLVVAFHAGSDRLSGGFVGVDVFFVLSGYLVTHVLLRDLAGDGRVRLGRFYARRVRRLLPAAAVCLVVTGAVYAAMASPSELDAARRSIQAAALYVTNWYFVAESADYFGATVDASPVAHFWSLSVEEQFYVFWPLLLAGAFTVARRAGRWRLAVVRGLVAAGGLASLAAALWIAREQLDRAYYGTDTRAYQLLAGALLALSPQVVAWVGARRAGPVVAGWTSAALVAAIAFVATSTVDIGPVTRGAVTTALTCALLAALEAAPGGVGRRLLSLEPVVYLGRISYGTYLWHWLVVLVATREIGLGPAATTLLAATVGTGLAALSHEVLEQPVRTARSLDAHRGPVVAAGLAVSAVVALVIVPIELEPEPSRAVAASATVRQGTPVQVDTWAAFQDTFDYDSCPSGGEHACLRVEGSGDTVLVVGDSHAGMLVPMFEDVARDHDLELHAGLLSYCPWPRGVKYVMAGADCFEEQDHLYETIVEEVDPDIVVLAHRPVDEPANRLNLVDRDEGMLGRDPQREVAALRKRIPATIEDLRRDGREVVVVEPIPVAPKEANPNACLGRAEFVEACRFVAGDRPTPEERIIRQVADADDRVWALDLDPLVCPYLPICDPVVDGRVVMRDDNHLTVGFGRSLSGPVGDLLVANGVLDRGAPG